MTSTYPAHVGSVFQLLRCCLPTQAVVHPFFSRALTGKLQAALQTSQDYTASNGSCLCMFFLPHSQTRGAVAPPTDCPSLSLSPGLGDGSASPGRVAHPMFYWVCGE